jgi:hypothetical protein
MQRSVRSAVTERASGLVVTCVYLPAALSGYVFADQVARFGWGNAALIQMSLLLVLPIAPHRHGSAYPGHLSQHVLERVTRTRRPDGKGWFRVRLQSA